MLKKLNEKHMRYLIRILFSVFLIVGCSNKKDTSLIEKIDDFKISECKINCGIDSIGIRKNEIKNGDLLVRLGYIVNCSWEQGSIKNINLKKDTLLIELDRPHEIDTVKIDSLTYEIVETYPLTDCECFFYFDLKIKEIIQRPNIIRISSTFEKDKYWDMLTKKHFRIEKTETEIKSE